MHRTSGRQSNQVYGITEPTLEKMLSATADNLRGIRDRALLLVAYYTMCRRSELVSLRVKDLGVNHTKDGIEIIIRLRRSNTGQELYGRNIYLKNRTTELINL
jgi:integrase